MSLSDYKNLIIGLLFAWIVGIMIDYSRTTQNLFQSSIYSGMVVLGVFGTFFVVFWIIIKLGELQDKYFPTKKGL